MPVTRLHLTVLGGFDARLRRPDRPVLLPTRRAEALLTYMALVPRRHRRDALVSLIWGDAQQGRQNLRQALSTLRTALGDHQDALVTTRDTVWLNPKLVRTDAVLLRRLVRRRSSCSVAVACGLYGGDLLQGIDIAALEFESWLALERASLKQLAVRACEQHLSHLIANRRPADAIQIALRLIGLDPLQEHVHRTLMQLYHQRGQIGAALRQYQSCARVLGLELGVEPEEETQRLWHDLLQSSRRPGRPRLTR